jgi:hypothetical protein
VQSRLRAGRLQGWATGATRAWIDRGIAVGIAATDVTRTPPRSLAAACGLALGALAACNRTQPWPPEAVRNFTTSCVASTTGAGVPADAARDRCACMVDHLQRHYTPEQFAAIDAKVAADRKQEIPPAMREAIAECAE